MSPVDNIDKNAVVATSVSRHNARKGPRKAAVVPVGATLPGHVALHDGTQLHGLLELLPFAVLRIGPHGRILQSNAAADALLGYGADALAGMSVETLIPGLKIRAPTSGQATAVANNQPARSAPSGMARCADGSEIPVTVITAPLSPAMQSDVVMTIIDQSQQYELELNKRVLAHMTRVSTLGQLAGSLAHELNQPLTAILSNVQTAQRLMASPAWNPTEIREILNDLVKDNHRASEVLRKVRLLVKEGPPEREPVSLGGVMQDVALLMHSAAIVRGIRLSLNIAPDLPPVCGDRVQLEQVVLNLVLNAFDALASRPPADRLVTIDAEPGEQNMVRVVVRDRGCGFSGDVLQSIFKPYFTSKREGLGLGLWISLSIVEKHGGRIWAEHNQGQGAAIFFTVPSMGAISPSAAEKA
ncbi:ATP-binding protein [Achromobacter aloeverae]|nr:ATP-binding protein [Achromobacter aloeverae]